MPEPVELPTSADLRTADARNRAVRTFLQGLGIDVLTAAAAALLVWLPDADLSSRDAWIVLGTGLARTVLGAVASYVMRAFMDPSKVPTPLPPEYPGPPADADPLDLREAEAGHVDALYVIAVVVGLLVVLILVFTLVPGLGR